MAISLLFAWIATCCGLALTRALRAPMTLAPAGGLATMAIVTTWCAPGSWNPQVSTVALLSLAAAGVIVNGQSIKSAVRLAHTTERVPAIVLGMSVLVPWLLLGIALGGLDAPVSTHDGAFHVEIIDSLRRGTPIQGWYPMGLHGSIAATLRLVGWVDTARGTLEAAQALAVLAPLAIFGLGRSIGLNPRVASLGALVQSLTYIYPYDDQLWGGWPLAASMLLVLGLWSVTATYIARPNIRLALFGGVFTGAILLTHGTEVYSSAIGLGIIALVNWRAIRPMRLLRHLPLAVLVAGVCAYPYLSTLLGWAAGGGATSVGAAMLEQAANQPEGGASGADWLEFLLGITGAGSLIDLPVRLALLCVGARQRRLRLALICWVVFAALLFVVSFVDAAPIRAIYVFTFPWLVRHRPPQLIVLFTSLLVGAGLALAIRWFWSLRPSLPRKPSAAWRRLALLGGALLFFFAEGSGVSIFKTLQQVVAEQNVLQSDDRAAMTWLHANVAPDELLINDGASDAGIWAPYKAGLSLLLPRSAPASIQDARGPILASLLDLESNRSLEARACDLHAEYVFSGSRRVAGDPPVLPDRGALERSGGLFEKVFASGDAVVFRMNGCSRSANHAGGAVDAAESHPTIGSSQLHLPRLGI